MAIIILGLGNPGSEYAKTRHNAGRIAAELIAKREKFDAFAPHKSAQALIAEGAIDGEKITIVLPEVFMNQSGKTASALVKSPKAAKNLLVIHDDLDMPVGSVKMVFGRGSGGHKGVESVMRAVKTKDFARIKIGTAGKTASGKAKKPSGAKNVVKHVIGKFSPSEEVHFKKALLRATETVRIFAASGLDQAIQKANTK